MAIPSIGNKRVTMFEDVLAEVPDYKTFCTVDDLDASSEELARKYPQKVKLFRIGGSRRGEDIRALKIGGGRKTALLFGFPHPDEPVGSMMLEYLSWRLCEDKTLDKLDYTWYIVKCADPDGTRLNEGWFKGPFTPLNLALSDYYPPFHQSVEWTFPVKYKTLVWNKPMPETRALMRIIGEIKPRFMGSLHNSGFGGVYYFVTSACRPLYKRFYDLVSKQGLPLHLGEPELPFMTKLAPAIFKADPISSFYEYWSRHTGEDPARAIKSGASSDEYAQKIAGTFTLTCETPFFTDPSIGDGSKSDVSRQDALLEGARILEDCYQFMKKEYSAIEMSTRFREERRTFIDRVESSIDDLRTQIQAQKDWARTEPHLDERATVAEKFDSCVLQQLNAMAHLGWFHRCVKGTNNKKVERAVLAHIKELNRVVERQLTYKVIPIRTLVRTQLGSVLLAADYIQKKSG